LRPARENSLQGCISKIKKAKWTEGVAQVVELLICKLETLNSKSQSHEKKKSLNADSHSWNMAARIMS
jgi:hypothetical protein